MQAFAMTWAKRSVFITVAFVQKITDVKDKPGKSTTNPQDQSKVFNDPIHGHVELHPLLVRIINTREFDRLRHLRQQGAAYYVFPGACHNRFEHSIGVAHLAGQFAQALKTKQPELGITNEDVLCVQIAGLCHDLGHGPFSHLFDGMFIPRARPDEKRTHEDHSVKMFDLMVKENKLKEEMQKYKLKPERDIIFIKEMMIGKPLTNKEDKDKEEQVANSPACMNESSPQWLYKGRCENKSFLYEIVANHTNEIDVDKFDYFARDCHHLGIQNHFDHHRFFQCARVCEVDGRKHICVRDKEVHNLYEMFYARCSFHRKACQHKVNSLIQTMITDAFLKADKHIPIKGSGGKEFTLSTAIDDMEAYTKLTDRVFDDILHSSSKDLRKAREIVNRIIKRDLYKCVGTVVTTNKDMTEEVKKQWEKSPPKIDGLKANDFALVVTSLDYGNGENDPISKVRFYSKANPDEAKPIPRDEVSRLLPEHFSEGSVRVYLKKKDENEDDDKKNLDDAKKHFQQLFTTEDFEVKDENQGLVARPRQAVKTSSPCLCTCG